MKNLYFIIINILIIQLLCHSQKDNLRSILQNYECKHSDLDYEIHKSDQKLYNQRRSLTEQVAEPIRVTFDTSYLDNLPPGYEKVKESIEKQIQIAQKWMSDKINVDRVQNNIKFPADIDDCIGAIPTQDDYEIGLQNSDLHIFVIFYNEEVSTIANAGACIIETQRNRPIFGRINYNIHYLQQLDENDNSIFENNLEITLHEITHILGFTGHMMQFWINPQTDQSYGKGNEPLLKQTIRGLETTWVTTNKLKQTAQEHYGCENLIGMQLENQGGAGSLGSHFERTIIQNEFMTASAIATDAAYSKFTFSLLEDTGWYIPNYSELDFINWGKNKGCDFLVSCSNEYKEFVNSSDQNCTFYHTAYGFGTHESFSDNCNYLYPYTNGLCNDIKNNNPDNDIHLGNEIGHQSKCFVSDIITTGASYSLNLRCYNYKCAANNLYIKINNEYYQCQDGVNLSVQKKGNNQQIEGNLQCPDNIYEFCNEYPSTCYDFCSQNGYCQNNQCYCIDGYAGEGCEFLCPDNQYIEDGICVEACSHDRKMQTSNRFCKKVCNKKCGEKNCLDPNQDPDTCLICSSSTRDINKNCECIEGYTENKNGIQTDCDLICQYPCLTCIDVPSNCLSCETTLNRISETDCSCESGYYDNNEECLKCDYQCKKCKTNSFTCIECSDLENRDLNNSCVCIVGFYDDGKSQLCQKCSYKCNECDLNGCKSCSDLTNRINDIQCLCKDTFYDDGTSQICKECQYPCLHCNSPTYCTNCVDDINRKQDCSCQEGYQDKDNKCVESPCNHQCKQCKTEDKNFCLSCSDVNRINEPTCECKNTYFNLDVNPICQKCVHPCINCNSKLQCSSCVEGNNRENISKNCVCQKGYYDIGQNDCKKCGNQCETCSNSEDQCDQCINTQNRLLKPGCLCISGYYQNLNLNCVICNYKCSECENNSGACKLCSDENREIQNNCECKPTFFEIKTQQNKICQKCQSPCQECNQNECITCIEGNFRSLPTCQCDKGYYENNIGICELCKYPCLHCKNETICESCQTQENRSIFSQDCHCNNGYYDNQQICDECSFKCKTCKSKDLCIECKENRDIQNNCSCIDTFYQNDQFSDCQKCEYPCLTCSSKTQCDQCIDNNNRNRDCSCLEGFYEKDFQCQKCDSQCLSCQKDSFNCIQCKEGQNRKLDYPYCNCQDGFQSQLQNNDCIEQIFNCSQIFIDIDYYEMDKLKIVFQEDLYLKQNEILKYQKTQNLCNLLFKNVQNNLFGKNPTCQIIFKIQNSEIIDVILINFSFSAKFKNSDQIPEFQENLFQKFQNGCDNVLVEEILQKNNISMKYKYFDQKPTLELKSIKVYSQCQPIIINVVNIKNHGNRDLENIQWQIVDKNQISNILTINQELKKQKSLSLVFKNHQLPAHYTYEFKLSFTNFSGIQGEASIDISIEEGFNFGIINQDEQKMENLMINQLYNIQFQVIVNYCLSKVQDQLKFLNNYTINYTLQQNYRENTSIYIKDSFNLTQDIFYINYEIEPFSHEINQNYSLQLFISLQNDKIIVHEEQYQIQYNFKNQYLLYIEGGQQQTITTQQYILTAIINNLSKQNDLLQDFQFKWKCINLKKNQQCKNKEGSLLDFENTQQITLDQNQFQEQQDYLFEIYAQNDKIQQNLQSSTIIQFVDEQIDIPSIDINISDIIYYQQISMDQNLQIEVKYNTEDIQFQNIRVLFNLIVQKQQDIEENVQIEYNYESISFKINDFTKINQKIFENLASNIFILNIEVIDSQFENSKKAQFKIQINQPPQISDLVVTPNEGISLETLFTLKVQENSEIQNSNQPFQYRFSYLLKENDVYYLNDYQQNNEIETQLPFNNDDNEQNLIIQVEILDTQGGYNYYQQQVKIKQKEIKIEKIQDKIKEIQQKSFGKQKQKEIGLLINEISQNKQKQQKNNDQELEISEIQQEIFKELVNSQISLQTYDNNFLQTIALIENVILLDQEQFCKNTQEQKQQINVILQGIDTNFRECKQYQKQSYGEGNNKYYRWQVQNQQQMELNCFQSIPKIFQFINNLQKCIKINWQQQQNIKNLRFLENSEISDVIDNNLDLKNQKMLQQLFLQIGEIYNQYVLPNQENQIYENEDINVYYQRNSVQYIGKFIENNDQNQLILNINNLKNKNNQNTENKAMVNFEKSQNDINSNYSIVFYQIQGIQVFDLKKLQQIEESNKRILEMESKEIQFSENLIFSYEFILSDSEIQPKQELYTCIQFDETVQLWNNSSCILIIENQKFTCQCKNIGTVTVLYDQNYQFLSKKQEILNGDPLQESKEKNEKISFGTSLLFIIIILLIIFEIILIIISFYKENKALLQVLPQKNDNSIINYSEANNLNTESMQKSYDVSVNFNDLTSQQQEISIINNENNDKQNQIKAKKEIKS